MTDYLEKQKVAGLKRGYNRAPAPSVESALPGMKGIDFQSWRDLLQPRHGEPFPAGQGAIEQMEAIRRMQYAPNVYAIKRLR